VINPTSENRAEGTTRHAVTRTYSGKGAKELLDVLAKHKSYGESIMPIQVFLCYTPAHTKDGGISVTVCQTEAGVEESVHKAREISEGPVILHVK
jgi:hypothetical protein